MTQLASTTGGKERIEIAQIWADLPSVSHYIEMTPWLLVAAVFVIVNSTLRPVLTILTCPLIVVTLGLFLWVINAGMLMLTACVALPALVSFVLGYAILKRVRELSGGRMEWTDGMLYPVLHRLERLGHVEARWEKAETGRRRKYYSITPGGQAQLAEERKQWQAVDATLRGIWQALFRPLPLRPGALVTPMLQAA